MTTQIWQRLFLIAPATLATTLVLTDVAKAGEPTATVPTASPNSLEQVASYAAGNTSVSSLEKVADYSSGVRIGNTVTQVTSVSQFSDVRPTDWAFQALQSLVERYGCIVGYPDKTFRGNRALTRYEFAAGLNACMDRINELIAASTADLVKKEDLDTLKRLQADFARELEEIKGRLDGLEARTATLEKQQFSTTTKLNGEVILGLAGVLGDDRALNSDQQRTIDAQTTAAARTNARNTALGTPRGVQENSIFGDRIRLAFDTSFSGRDRLRTQLQARNITPFNTGVTGTNMTRLGYDGNDGDNTVFLRRVEYRFPIGQQLTVFVGGGTNDGLEFNDSLPVLNGPLDSSGSGSISRFGRFNPIYRAGTGTGIIANLKLGSEYTFLNKFTLSAGYLVPSTTANNPLTLGTGGGGLFNGTYAALGQLVFQPSANLSIGATYVNAFYRNGTGITGGTGSTFANQPFVTATGAAVPTSANSYGLQASYRLSPGFIISGWGGYTVATAEAKLRSVVGANSPFKPRAEIWNWAVTLAFPDLFKEGNLAGIVFGQPPRVTNNDFNTFAASTATTRPARRKDNDTSFHIEGFYRFRINDNIAVTPGLLVILNPEGNASNDPIYVGTVRTTFTF